MLVKNLNDCEMFIAGDHTQLRELLHPDKQPLNLRYSLAHAIVPAGQTSIDHALTTSEVYTFSVVRARCTSTTRCKRWGQETPFIFLPMLDSTSTTPARSPSCFSVLWIRLGELKTKPFTPIKERTR